MPKVTDVHVRRLFRLLGQGRSLSVAARQAGIDRKTARRYREMKRLPSDESAQPREWRTRPDAFAEVWPVVAEQLAREPKLQAKTLWEWLRQQYPGRFADGQLRTLQRRVKHWRASRDRPRKCSSPRCIIPAGWAPPTSRTGQPGRDHRRPGLRPPDLPLRADVLELGDGDDLLRESFESLSDGLQNALWELGGVPQLHRTDRLTAAVSHASERREFSQRYQALLTHYGLQGQAIQARQGNENGDAERHIASSKTQWTRRCCCVAAGTSPAGKRTWRSSKCSAQRNAGRPSRLAEEQALLRPLPTQRLEACKRLDVRVRTGSMIHVQSNVYSVASRLIGEWVEARLYPETVEVWYAQKLVETLPRLRGRGKQRIDYRHVIDWLVRKPGAFADYRYREELFPSSHFRMAYDVLHETQPSVRTRSTCGSCTWRRGRARPAWRQRCGCCSRATSRSATRPSQRWCGPMKQPRR